MNCSCPTPKLITPHLLGLHSTCSRVSSPGVCALPYKWCFHESSYPLLHIQITLCPHSSYEFYEHLQKGDMQRERGRAMKWMMSGDWRSWKSKYKKSAASHFPIIHTDTGCLRLTLFACNCFCFYFLSKQLGELSLTVSYPRAMNILRKDTWFEGLIQNRRLQFKK